jgi:Arabinose efflux permease
MNQKIVLLVLSLGTLMAAVDTTIVLLALPTITDCLHTNLFSSIWVLLAYLIVLAVLSTQAGRIGDLIGRGKIYNFGFILFTLASALAGISPNVCLLISFRVIQAIGGALLTSNSYAIIADVFPPNSRGKAYGITALGWNVGALLGIVLGGVLTTFFGWRFIFYINVPIGIISVILGIREIRDSRVVKNKLDITGSVILGVSLALISVGSMMIAGIGVDIMDVVEIILGVALLPIFVINESKVQSPIINLKLFKIRLLSFSLLASLFQGIGALSITFFLIMYLQGVRGLTPLQSSLLLTPGYVVASVLAPFMGRIADRGRPDYWAGIVYFSFSHPSCSIFYSTPSTPYFTILGITAITGIGSAIVLAIKRYCSHVFCAKEYYGSVSGVSRTLGSIGTTLSYVMSITVATLVIPRQVAFEIFLGTNVLDGDVSNAFVNGLHFAFMISAIIIIIATLFSVLGGSTNVKRSY